MWTFLAVQQKHTEDDLQMNERHSDSVRRDEFVYIGQLVCEVDCMKEAES